MTKIIACFAGVGKTYTAINDNKTLDFVVMPYKYKSCLTTSSNKTDYEKDKGMHFDFIPNWQLKYVEDLINIYKFENYRAILIPTDCLVLKLLKKSNIPYSICIPEQMSWENYKIRFINRGNTEEFIDIMYSLWFNILDTLRNDDYANKILQISKDEYLLDVIKDILES